MPTPHKPNPVALIENLTIDSHLESDIYDIHGILLLAKDTQVSSRLLKQLKQRGITHYSTSATVDQEDIDRLNSPDLFTDFIDDAVTQVRPQKKTSGKTISELDQQIKHASYAPLPCQPNRLGIKQLKEEVHKGIKTCTKIASVYSKMTQEIVLTERIELDTSEYQQLLSIFQEFNAKDKSILPLIVKMQNQEKQYIKHAINTTMIAILLAEELNFSEQAVQDIGCAALLQDLGMLKIPEYVRKSSQNLSKNERRQIQQHPLYTLDLLKNHENISEQTLITIYQSHERCDSTGYPNAHAKNQIHPLARILAVADTYVALIADRPHRKAIGPHQAMQKLLEQASQGKHDVNVVRALLNTLSAFPIGSIVRLNDGTTARVIWSNRQYHTKPVVAQLNHDAQIDLSLNDERHIIAALNDDWEQDMALETAA